MGTSKILRKEEIPNNPWQKDRQKPTILVKYQIDVDEYEDNKLRLQFLLKTFKEQEWY